MVSQETETSNYGKLGGTVNSIVLEFTGYGGEGRN